MGPQDHNLDSFYQSISALLEKVDAENDLVSKLLVTNETTLFILRMILKKMAQQDPYAVKDLVRITRMIEDSVRTSSESYTQLTEVEEDEQGGSP